MSLSLVLPLCSKISFSKKYSLVLLPHLNCALVFLYAKMMIKCVFHLPYRVTIKIFPGSSAGKDSACSSGDPGSILGLGSSPGEGIGYPFQYFGAFLSGLHGKESTCNVGHLGSIPGSGRSPGGSHGNPLQYSCLESPHGQRSLVGYSPWGCKELDMTERLSTAQHKDLKR